MRSPLQRLETCKAVVYFSLLLYATCQFQSLMLVNYYNVSFFVLFWGCFFSSQEFFFCYCQNTKTDHFLFPRGDYLWTDLPHISQLDQHTKLFAQSCYFKTMLSVIKCCARIIIVSKKISMNSFKHFPHPDLFSVPCQAQCATGSCRVWLTGWWTVKKS